MNKRIKYNKFTNENSLEKLNKSNIPFLSIIIPVLNEEKRLKELIPYLITHAPHEEIIVVDCPHSNDNTKSLLSQFSFTYLPSKKAGRAGQMNTGALHAKGNVYMFLHADVLPPPNFVKAIKEQHNAGYNAGFFAYNFDPSNRWLEFNSKYTGSDGLFAGGGDQCQFMTKQVFNEFGGYDERYVIMEDFALVRKMKKQKLPLTIIQERALVSSRKYETNSYLKVNLVNLVVFSAFLLGVSPSTLKKMYSFSLK